MSKNKNQKIKQVNNVNTTTIEPQISWIQKIQEWWKRFSSQVINRLLLKFIGLMTLFYLVWANQYVQETLVKEIANMYAKVSGEILNLMGAGVAVTGDIIASSYFSIGIKNGCDGIEGLAIYWCALAIYPATLKYKITGFLWGTLFLVVLNIIRIISLYEIGVHVPSIFDVMHESIWQILFILLTLVGLFVWVDWLHRNKSAHSLLKS